MEFESGVVVEGVLVQKLSRDSKNLVLVFEDCSVRKGQDLLFDPKWGTFDMACGEKVVSVFGGAADRATYLEATGGFRQTPGKPKSNLTSENKDLNLLYARVWKIRNDAKWNHSKDLKGVLDELEEIYSALEKKYPNDWLLRYELLEISSEAKLTVAWAEGARQRLKEISQQSKDKREMIDRGMELL